MMRRRGKIGLIVLLTLSAPGMRTAAEGPAQEDPPLPETYILDYPAAERFCPPISSTFYEVKATRGVANGRHFRQQPNGGWGLPILQKVDGKRVLHTGADLGWYQVGSGVHAVAAGVVRISEGPVFADKGKSDEAKPPPGAMPWGNLIAIEHRLADDEYVTTVYGHLDAERLVFTGDAVNAGQPIGFIGRQHVRINGGYKPHLHFGVRRGRMAEKGSTLMRLTGPGGSGPVKLVALGEEEIEVDFPFSVANGAELPYAGSTYYVALRDGKYYLPATILWDVRCEDFPLVGYALSIEGWEDPIAFLKSHRADVDPAPFLPLRGARSARRRN